MTEKVIHIYENMPEVCKSETLMKQLSLSSAQFVSQTVTTVTHKLFISSQVKSSQIKSDKDTKCCWCSLLYKPDEDWRQQCTVWSCFTLRQPLSHFFFPAVLHMSSLEPEEDEICSQGLEKEEEEEGCVLML